MTDPLNLEPPDGDYVRYIESLQTRGAVDLKPLEPEDFAQDNETPEKGGGALAGLLKALNLPGASPRDESREQALARMEAASAGENPVAASVPKPKKRIDPALKFISSAFAMFGLMGMLAGLESGENAPVIFGAFAVFISAVLLLNGRFGPAQGSQQRRRPRGDRH